MSRIFSFLLLCFSLFAVNCGDNPLTVEPTTDSDESIPILVPTLATDSLSEAKIDSSSLNLGELHFYINLGEIRKNLADSSLTYDSAKTLKKGLASAINDRLKTMLYKTEKLDSAQFIITDSLGRSVKAGYPIDAEGKCSVRIIKVPRGFKYHVEVKFSGTTICPWSPDEFIVNCFFSAFDAVDLISKTKDTLSLVLTENLYSIYFVSVKNAPGKFTVGKKYTVKEEWNKGAKVQALYSGNEFKHRIYCGYNDSTAQFTVDDDTGIVICNLSFNISSVCDNNVVEGTAKPIDIDTGDGRIVINMAFEKDLTLKVMRIAPQSGGVILYFNRGSAIKYDSISVFRVTLGSDTANIAKKSDLQGGVGYIYWQPKPPPKAGTYTMRTEGFLDEYGEKRSIFSSHTIIFQ